MARGQAIAVLVIGLLLWKGRGVLGAGKNLLGEPMPTGASPESSQQRLDRAATTITTAPDATSPTLVAFGPASRAWVVPDNIKEAAAISGMTVDEWLAAQGA